MAGAEVRPGDWSCPGCGANVFASKASCYKCGTPKPDGAGGGAAGYGGGYGGGAAYGGAAAGGGYGAPQGGGYGAPQAGGYGGGYGAPQGGGYGGGSYGAAPGYGAGAGGGYGAGGGAGAGSGAGAGIQTEFRPGDWNCPSCGAHCFASKYTCFKCQTAKPADAGGSAGGYGGGAGGGGGGGGGGGAGIQTEFRPGDWNCPSCNAHCFASKYSCFKCNTAKPADAGGASFGASYGGGGGGGGGGSNVEVRPGDWTCPSCQSNVFASKSACFRCGTPKPGGASGGRPY